MSLEREVQTFGWQSMKIEELLNLCKTNKAFNQLCNNQQTWQFLLKRDFSTQANNDARKEYFGNVLKDVARNYNDQAMELDRKMRNDELPAETQELDTVYEILGLKDLALSALGYDSIGNANIMGSPVKNDIFGNTVGDQLIGELAETRKDLQYTNPNATLIDALLLRAYGR